MADKVSYTDSLKIEFLFVDGDTRTLNLDNPKTDISREQILALEQTIKANNLLVGDKYGGDFRRIEKVTKVRKSVSVLDI